MKPFLLAAFLRRGGVRATLLNDGVIRQGDAIRTGDSD